MTIIPALSILHSTAFVFILLVLMANNRYVFDPVREYELHDTTNIYVLIVLIITKKQTLIKQQRTVCHFNNPSDW